MSTRRVWSQFRVGRLVIVGVTSAVMLGASAIPASANHSWSGYHWARSQSPFSLRLGDNVGVAWDSHLAAVSADWSLDQADPTWLDATPPPLSEYIGPNPLNTNVVSGQTTGRRCRPSTSRIEVCNAGYGANGWLGLASVWISGGHIVQATVKVNDTYFNTATYNTPEWRQSVMCQEVGHTFGLSHQDESGADLDTCMDYSRSPNIHPDQHDYNQLALSYSHADSSTGGSVEPVVVAPATGRGLERVREGLYVENLGGGQKRFVWVFWKGRGPHHGAPQDAG